MSVKRKIDIENRSYKESWESDYLIANNNGKLQCLVCMNIVSVPKEYNVRRHYTTMHEKKYATYTNESRRALVADLKKKLKQQTGMFSKILRSQTHSLHASYAVSLELAKAKKPFTDANLIKKCAVEMAKAFEDSKMAEKFESVQLSHQTIQRRVVAMGEQVENSMLSLVKKSSYFSLCLDESTDQSDVSQLLIFVRTTFEDFTSKEELFDICPLYGTTKGKDVYEALKKTVDRIGGFNKCSAIATDGAPSMTGKKTGLLGLLRENGVTCPTIHCIIHQGALCGKSVKQDQVFQTVIKIINMIRGGNRSLLHRQLRQFLVDTEAEYENLLMYNHVRWLSAGKCMERFFAIRKEIPPFLNKYVSSDTTELEEKFQDPEFLRQLAFITDLTNHLNSLNLSLQGRNQTVSDLVGIINGFRNKLNVFKHALEKNNLTHFPSCLKLAEEPNSEKNIDFSCCSSQIQQVINEFNTRFKDIESLKSSVLLYNNPLGASIEDQPPDLQLELCDLQADMFLITRQEKGPEFFKLLSKEKFPNLRDFGLKMTSMFGSTYICESAFSYMKYIKNPNISNLTDSTLRHLMRLSTTELAVDISSLVGEADRPQSSH
ncbi:general transcription factor II-I repeat domain-containing protein 2B-like [Melanaphis sacchari]|uniref:general transcription factor II-I repeat domain-containing protein 2B-like n=1 Tax=Melanaphis sacchari TaxID=742174 RepID=UPI000DC1308F|nr:general transcription factor II-I repeat domain-containing protein 2B-like [Melanaphis sacchari]